MCGTESVNGVGTSFDSSKESSLASFAKAWVNSGRGRDVAFIGRFTKLHPLFSRALKNVGRGSSRGRDYTCNPRVCDRGGRCSKLNAKQYALEPHTITPGLGTRAAHLG